MLTQTIMADYLSIFAAGGRTAEFGQYVTTHGRKLLMENFDEEAQQFSPKYTVRVRSACVVSCVTFALSPSFTKKTTRECR